MTAQAAIGFQESVDCPLPCTTKPRQIESGERFPTSWTPKWIDLIELYEETKDKKYLDANKMNRAVSLILMGQEQVGRNELIKLKESYPHGEFLNELIKLDKKAYINQILND